MPIGIKGESWSPISIETLITPWDKPGTFWHVNATGIINPHGDTGLTGHDGIGQRLPLIGQQSL